MIRSYIGKNVLITTSNWFYAPDGIAYKSVFGKVSNIQLDEANKIIFIELVNMLIPGNEILNIIATEDVNSDKAKDYVIFDGEPIEFKRPSHVYMAMTPLI